MKKAFTLAETLITITIIGVVASLTISNLVKSYQRKIYLNQFKQAVSILSQGYYRIAADADGKISNLRKGYSNDMRDYGKSFYEKYFKIHKMCSSYDEHLDCLTYTVKSLNKKNNSTSWCSQYNYPMILNNGMIFCLPTNYDSQIDGYRIGVDINGPKGPNVNGYDVFMLKLFDNGTIGHYVLSAYNYADCDIKGNGTRCSEWIMKFGNMDYLDKSYPNTSDVWKK